MLGGGFASSFPESNTELTHFGEAPHPRVSST